MKIEDLKEIIYEDIPDLFTAEYLKKVVMFEAAAEKLDLEDIYELGLIYHHGVNSISGENGTNETRVIIKPDPVKSSKYFRMIVKRQLSDNELYVSSSYYLGIMHFIDVEYINDNGRATHYLTNASHGGCSDAEALLSYINKEEIDKEVIFKRVFDWHMDNQNKHRLKITFNIGWMYFKGFGADQDYAKALYYVGISADQNYTDAQTLLGILYEKGYATDQNSKKAIEWYTKAADQNNAITSYNLGSMYFYDRGVEVDYQLAFQHYQAAVDQGHAGSQFKIGAYVPRSIPDKNADTWNTLGEIYHSADTQFQDFRKAFECYEQTDGRNKDHSLRGLGLIYEHGDGVDKNYEKSFEYYMLSQMEGNKGACYNIALLCYYGKGVVQYFFAALEYFERVLEAKREKDATYVLVESDIESNSCFDQQKKKYSFVPERIIYGEAHYCLGIMNEKGQGTCQDHEKALYHFKRSHSYGIDRAKKFLELQ